MQERFRPGTKEYLDDEVRRLRDSVLPEEVKEKIENFLKRKRAGEKELSYNRLRFHAVNLRIVFSGMMEMGLQDKILEPDAEAIEDAISHQRERPSQRHGQPLSEWTIEGFKSSLKVFYRWLGKPEAVSTIKYRNDIDTNRKRDFSITDEEVQLLIDSCDNARDKAIFSVLYDSGIRLGELFSMTIADAIFPESGGLLLQVSGKTGVRTVPVIGDSVGDLRAWLNIHPDQFNDDAWLFCTLGTYAADWNISGRQMTHAQVYRMFSKVKARAVKKGFPANKRINPHKFRHNRATEHVRHNFNTRALQKIMGWRSSKMLETYEHLNSKDVADALYSAYGVGRDKSEVVELRKVRVCLKCTTPNQRRAKHCLQCGAPLDPEIYKAQNEEIDKMSSALQELDGLPKYTKNQLKKEMNPVDKIEFVSDILEELMGDPETKEALKKRLLGA